MAITSSKYAVTARPVSILAQLLGMVVIILVLVWVLHFEGGLAFKSENKKKILNLHAVFMILGPVLAAGEGAEKSSKSTLLPWHIYAGMVIFVLAVCSTEIGLAQAFISLGLGRTQEALIVNFTGLFVFLFAASVGLTVFLPRGD
ncbi:hypothetical protein TIFTF001_007589 [Ficus carica]|uniref:Cytochrome b561 domain-containing protein n=1 Tax=Ficus carica TaxID=3494 RepID=A0AA87ZQM2_FICCA|nr:hypothetical protein TIFTF001_007589 [Ficus carica]